MKQLAFVLSILFCFPTLAAPAKPMFAKGAETFAIKDTTGKTPSFRILDDTPSERALAVAVITAANSQDEVEPKLPVTDYVDLKIQKMTFTPVKGDPSLLEVTVNVSGHELELDKKVSRKKFLAGDTIALNFPKSEKSLSFFEIQSGGSFRFNLDVAKSELRIQEAAAKMSFQSPLAGDGDENIRFAGRGLRELM